MARDKSRRAGPPGATVTAALALLLVICLVECATEQRIISRGSKPNHIQKVNGWRSQRGGSCLSYGHSCWGAHGKRSAKPPATTQDWFLSKLFRRVDANTHSDMEHARQVSKHDDNSAIYQVDNGINSLPTDQLGSDIEDYPLEVTASRNPEAKPMLDDDLLAKIKLWQIMREASLE